jgi:hypothetical protein
MFFDKLLKEYFIMVSKHSVVYIGSSYLLLKSLNQYYKKI